MEPMLQPALRRTVASRRIVAVRKGSSFDRTDRLAAEEPMEIRAGGPGEEPVAVAVTMRTPGHDFELAAGFLFTEGLIAGREDVAAVAYCELPPDEQRFNVVTLRLTRPFDPGTLRRNFYATSSCGICGKASMDQVEARCEHLPAGPAVRSEALLGMPGALREAQRILERTGGLHAAGLFDPEGGLLSLREDVGRHNAVDKLAGQAVLAGDLPLRDLGLMAAGRGGLEPVQKGAVAREPGMGAGSAPSSPSAETGAPLGPAVG